VNDLPAKFIGVAIEPVFLEPPQLEKRPGAPDGFVWEGRKYLVENVLREWHDYGLKGKTRTFYEKEQGSFRAAAASRRGTWGVGRDYFRVAVDSGEVFDLYYDRDPGGTRGRKGGWYLFRQILDAQVDEDQPPASR
jgi:hypothetical protein